MSYKISRRLIFGGIKISIKVPATTDFRTPSLQLSWEGGYGIVDSIEKGISGLSYYVSNRTNLQYSRSGEGVQRDNPVRNAEFKKRPWISPIFKAVKDRAKDFR